MCQPIVCVCACARGGRDGGHAHAPARSTAGPSRPLNGSCCNLGADQALGDLPPSPFICAWHSFELSLLSPSLLGFPGSVIHGSDKIKGRVHLLLSTVAVWLQHAFRQLWNQSDTDLIEWSLCRNPGSPHIIMSTPGFLAPFPLHYKELIHKWRHLVEGDVIEMIKPIFLLFISRIRQKQKK